MGETITQIGRYEISRQLVESALASVYDAFDPVERKPVAIRVPRTTQHEIVPPPIGLSHPGLMNVLSYEESKGESFLVLEPFQGTSLDSLIQTGKKIPPADAIELLKQLASVLDYAHSHGMLHGCLQPSSILLNDRKQIKVLDLGSPASAGRYASPDQLLHAVHYLSPECIRDQPMDGRSDQFSLAVLAHAMLTGELPFSGKPLGAMFRIAYQMLERDAIRELPAGAQTVFQRSLSKRASDRYATCGEMVEALSGALLRPVAAPTRLADASEFTAPRPPVPAPAAENRSWTRHLSGEAVKYFGATFILFGLLLAGILYFLLPKAPPKPVPVATPPAVVSAPRVVSNPTAHTPPPAPKPEAKAVPKVRAKKKTEPEVELKPVEPKIIHP